MRGAIIGDIIGSPYEGFGQQKVYDIRLWAEGSHPTDDSALTIATAEAILTGKSYIEMYHKYWYEFPWAGYGFGFSKFMTYYKEGDAGYGSYGNGSAMRVSPVAWAFDDLSIIQEEARKSAECTHNHPEGIKGAVATATMIYYASGGADKEFLKKLMEEDFGYDVSQTLDEMREGFEWDESCQKTMPPAFRCVYEGDSFTEIIRLAASLGGDADTLACIAGSIAEAIYGVPEGMWETSKEMIHHYFEGCEHVIDEFENKYMGKK
jgi:ADP-ribosylglycohydrolase